MNMTSRFLGSKRFNLGMKIIRKILPIISNKILNNKWNDWGKNRDLPEVPKESFIEWYEKNKNSKA